MATSTSEPHSVSIPEPLPLSFPSILINPRLKHLTHPQSMPNQHHPIDHSRPQVQGRRRQKRLENATFSSNPHVTRPTPADYHPRPPVCQPTFPVPPPPQFPLSLIAPGREVIKLDPPSAAMGSFNRSLKGVRKNIRRMVVGPRALTLNNYSETGGGRVQEIIKIVDDHLSAWIKMGVVWMPEDLNAGLDSVRILDPTLYPNIEQPARPTLELNQDPQPTIVEFTRSPHKLAWDVPDPFARYLVHSIARYYGIISFSRQRLQPNRQPQQMVWMVRAHLPTQQGSRVDGRRSLDTPPTTDIGSELSTAELSDVPSTTDDEHDHPPSPTSPSHPSLSTPDRIPACEPQQLANSSRAAESDDADDSSRCASDNEEIDSHLSDSGFVPPKPIVLTSDLTPRGKPNWVRTSPSTTPRPSNSVSQPSRVRSEPAARIKLPQQYQQLKNKKAQITSYAVPTMSFLEWIWADA
ncbi:hypothetical protein CROQUDRAFT_95639 [Cronartium quercuum f. sp. fusiforme G11]|uniref:R3H domain-containing protein n=1 Tax=Cronartium quercuum f. sp. fusiforme G11 TaxID=708437 RepID=A0A9P6TAU1_9BASI|nr:hypothetical protein CROQUDRAFT_95639 [Cronartium quercuum f. sp. fusiforme G11]